MRGVLAALAVLACAAAARAQGPDAGPSFTESVRCGGVDAALIVGSPGYDGPTLEIGIGGRLVDLENGPDYAGPFCVKWRGVPHVGYVEYMGNAYEAYRVVHPTTLEVTEITYREAERIGWYD